MQRHLSDQHQTNILSSVLGIERVEIEDDPYQRISRNDEGNIGGTLSNNDTRSPEAVYEEHIVGSRQRDNSAVM